MSERIRGFLMLILVERWIIVLLDYFVCMGWQIDFGERKENEGIQRKEKERRIMIYATERIKNFQYPMFFFILD